MALGSVLTGLSFRPAARPARLACSVLRHCIMWDKENHHEDVSAFTVDEACITKEWLSPLGPKALEPFLCPH